MFPDAGTSAASQDQPAFQFGPPPPGAFGDDPGGTASGADPADRSSERTKKQGRVLAVSDPRTASLIVSAASTLMPQIAKMIAELDAREARKEVVKVWELRNAEPHDVNQILQELFNRNITLRNNNNLSPLLGQNDPLSARLTQSATANATTSTSRSGNVGGGGGGGGTGGQ